MSCKRNCQPWWEMGKPNSSENHAVQLLLGVDFLVFFRIGRQRSRTIAANLNILSVQTLPLTLVDGHFEWPNPLITVMGGKWLSLFSTAIALLGPDIGYSRIGPQ
jgi:hypothetical protein